MEDVIVILSDEELVDTFTDDIFKQYMNEIKKYPLLSKEETLDLFRRYQSGDFKAREELINSNLRLVVNVANHYRGVINHLHILDIIQEGNLGLMRAVETYDPEQGAFSTYAFPWIRQRITRSLSNSEATIRKPVHMDSLIRKYKRLIDKNPDLSDAEIMDELDIDAVNLKTIRDTISNTVVSMNQKVGDEEDTELEDFISVGRDPGYDEIENNMVTHDLCCILREVLNDREYFVLYHRVLMGENVTLETIGELLNLSRERVRQIEAKAIRKMRPVMERDSYKASILNRIKDKYGKGYVYLNVEPKSIEDIILFLYVKEELLGIEVYIYHDMLFGEYKYSRKSIAYKYGISEQDVIDYEKSIKLKVDNKLRNKRLYKIFFNETTRKYGSNIFNVNLLEGIDNIDYSVVNKKYINLSLDEIKNIFGDLYDNLTIDEKNLLDRFFVIPGRKNYSKDLLERDINLALFGFKDRRHLISKSKLYKTYLDNIKYFNEEQRMYLENVYFGKGSKDEFRKKYPNSNLLRQDIYLIERLEKIYFKIYKYLDNSFNQERYLEVKAKYGDKLSSERIKILDMFYGVGQEEVSIKDMAVMYGYTYVKMHGIVRDAREYAMSLYYNKTTTLFLDKSLYSKYILSYDYDFTDETRYILKLFIIEGKSYDEINELTNLGNYRISNIITEGIRKMDLYRFNIIRVNKVDKDIFDKFMSIYSSKFDEKIISLLRDKFFNRLSNPELCSKYEMDNKDVNIQTSRFYKMFYQYKICSITVSLEDIVSEVLKHRSESVLSDEEKKFICDYYGINTPQLQQEELMKKYKFNSKQLVKYYTSIMDTMKGYKCGELYPEYLVIPRDKLNKLLKDRHLPISDKERFIIGSLFEIGGYEYKSDEELAGIYGERKANMKRRYQRGILSICKYLNKEIDGNIDFELDVEPNLKYFSNSDRLYLIEYYKNGLTYDDVSRKYNISIHSIITTYNRLNHNLFDIIDDNEEAKKFDFDYYREVFMRDDVPYYGDKELAKKIFDLFTGESTMQKMSLPKITEELGLDYSESTLIHLVDEVLLSVCRYREGITKEATFTPEEIADYYERNKDNLGWRVKEYKGYFERLRNRSNLNGKVYYVNYSIIFDLIKDKYSNYFSLSNCDSEKIIMLIKKYGHKLLGSTKRELMSIYGINERVFMNGKEINHVYRILYGLDVKKKKLGSSFSMKKPSYE